MTVIIMFIIIICVGIIVFLPPYEKLVYSKRSTYEYEEIQEDTYGYEGCKGSTSISVVDASDTFQEIAVDPDKFFVLKADDENIEPLGIYRPASCNTAYHTYETNSFEVFFLQAKESYAQ